MILKRKKWTAYAFQVSDEELDTESEEEDTEEFAVDAEKDVVGTEESAIENGSISSM